MDYLHSEWWRGAFYFCLTWIHFISSWGILEEYVILFVEGCSLSQYAKKYNWYLLVSLSVLGIYSNALKKLCIFLFKPNITDKHAFRQRGGTNHCLLGVNPAYLGLVNHWTKEMDITFCLSCFLNSQVWWQSSSCTTVLWNNWATVGLQLSLNSAPEKGFCVWCMSRYEFHPSLNCMTVLLLVEKQNTVFSSNIYER